MSYLVVLYHPSSADETVPWTGGSGFLAAPLMVATSKSTIRLGTFLLLSICLLFGQHICC